jgi:hypothetical protein
VIVVVVVAVHGMRELKSGLFAVSAVRLCHSMSWQIHFFKCRYHFPHIQINPFPPHSSARLLQSLVFWTIQS